MNSKNTQGKIAAIHQPSFFPWLGFFDKIIRSDIFVILDNVQFPKKGGYWANRVKIIISGKPEWLTMPIVRSYSGFRKINEMEIDNSKSWNEKTLKTIDVNYKKAPHYSDIFPELINLLESPGTDLTEFNIKIINHFCNILNIDTSHFVKASALNTEGHSTDLLLSIIRALNADAYMYGGGASGYQENDKFEAAGIKLIAQNFKQPEYPQVNTKEFVPGLSIIDVLMNCGLDSTKSMIHSAKKL